MRLYWRRGILSKSNETFLMLSAPTFYMSILWFYEYFINMQNLQPFFQNIINIWSIFNLVAFLIANEQEKGFQLVQLVSKSS